jgi:hypothetical protein
MTVRNKLLLLGFCVALSATAQADVGTVFGTGNSGAALIDDFAGTDTQPNCVGDWLSTAASTNRGLDIPGFMDGNGGPGSITGEPGDGTGIGGLMGLGVVIGSDIVSAWDYDSCGDQYLGEN